jgi:RNA polymerase III subunit RPC82 helix-turn-helix domain
MTTIAMKLCGLILQEHFGETVRIVGQDLFAAVSKTISGICSTTKLNRKQVKPKRKSKLQHTQLFFSD